jgi:ABC-type multidrug transport system ATPase subunit
MPDIAVKVEDLTYVYPGKNAVIANDHLSFEIPRGEIFGLLGPNGAGKTTLVLQLLGLLRPTSGQIWLEGIDVVKAPQQASQRTGFLPQTGIPMRYVEVKRALYFTGRLRGQTHHDARQQAQALLSHFEMNSYAKRFVNDLSGGMLRLVNFAMALMGNPHVLILDEPTNELDPVRRRQVWDTITQLNQQEGVTCILVTHNLLEAEQVVQRVAIMRAGKIIALDTPGTMKLSSTGKVRLEFQLKAAAEIPARLYDSLDQLGAVDLVRPGSYTITLMPDDVSSAADLVISQIGLQELEDFRVSPPSLEDAYLTIEKQQLAAT